MLRTFIGAVLTLALVGGVGLAGDKGKAKKANTFRGTIKKVDAKEGTLTVAVKAKKKSVTDKEFKVSTDTKVVVVSGEEKKIFTGTEGLKKEGFKEGANVVVVADENDATKVKEVRLGMAKKKNKAS